MIEHVSIPVADIGRAREFYSKVLPTLGYKAEPYDWGEAIGYTVNGPTSVVLATAAPVVPMHLALGAKSKKEVEAFHAAALAAGGKDNGAPGYRTQYNPGYYAAFVYDLDGNNIEAVWFDPEKVEK